MLVLLKRQIYVFGKTHSRDTITNVPQEVYLASPKARIEVFFPQPSYTFKKKECGLKESQSSEIISIYYPTLRSKNTCVFVENIN